MSKPSYIINTPLPPAKDFEALKAQGLAYIQQYGGNDWTNLNAGDPGVTILEQVCYALTELGYCNDFSIADILTRPDGTLQFENQFYLPQNILTTCPVTIDDYRKYLIDGVAGIGNVIVVANPGLPYTYSTYIQPITQIAADAQKCRDCCDAALVLLNKSRNLGELFNQPELLEPVVYEISGRIDIAAESDAQSVLLNLQQGIRQFIFPDVTPLGYSQLEKGGFDVNDILNGPLLKNGWIPTTSLGTKKDKLMIVDVAEIAVAVNGVQAISGFAFAVPDKNTQSISCTATQLLTVDVEQSFSSGKLQLFYKGKPVMQGTASPQGIAPMPDASIMYGASVTVQTNLPQGRYRDIDSYYSIQNTFPQIYNIGPEGVSNNAPALIAAQARQLKGYLTLFDQVLANQFSQLSNIGTLFSFKNATTGTPSEEEEYYAVQTAFERTHPQYPVPYLSFSPTYFYQLLYDVPNIEPLLKDHDIFNFSFTEESEKELKRKAWEAYKNDPYNTYAWGLMQLMEDENINLQRRDSLLDHLLARHGESPEVIDAYIDGSVLSGRRLKDKVIFKSLFLQNLGLWSYYRQKGCNYTATNILTRYLPAIPVDFEKEILKGYSNDFIFNSEKMDAAEKLYRSDFISYSGPELSISLLFGLKMAYKEFIALPTDELERRVAFWLITQKKGLLLVEMPLLMSYLSFTVMVTENVQQGPYFTTVDPLAATDAINLETALTAGNVSFNPDNNSLQTGNTVYTLQDTQPNETLHWQQVTNTPYSFSIATKRGTPIANLSSFSNQLCLLLPDFIPAINTADFDSRINLFLQNTLPVHLDYTILYTNAHEFRQLIRRYAIWHNSLRYHEPPVPASVISNNAEALFSFLLTV